MAKRELHARAIEMRKQGMSYSQIKKELGISKSTLSTWLQAFPLDSERIRALQADSEIRIERCRQTKAKNRESRQELILQKVRQDIGILSDRELFLAGLFLYWGEGGKTEMTTTSISNTDPAVLVCFKEWLSLLGVPDSRMRVYLHLYADMDREQEMEYWSDILRLPLSSFRKPYIKESTRAAITYSQRFSHGTCNLMYHGRDIGEYIHKGIEALELMFIAPGT